MTNPRIFHARQTGVTVPQFSPAGDPVGGRVLRQWETFEVTDELIELTRDRLGNSWLEMDAAEQTKRWGMVKFAEGEPPADAEIGSDDEGFLYQRGLRAREQARAISNPADRGAALAEVARKYGAALEPKAQ